MVKQNIISGISAAVIFIVLYSVLHWNFLVSFIIAIGTFIGIFLIMKPVPKIGDVEMQDLKDGMALHALYAGALADLLKMEEVTQDLTSSNIQGQCTNLVNTGHDILNYLENNPREISKSRHFLEYYFETAKKIITNYGQLKRANISSDKFQHIADKTSESLDLLQKIFANQRDSYHEDKVMALEVETDLLEKTIRLSGGDIQ